MKFIEELTKRLIENKENSEKSTKPVKKIMDADDVKIDFANAQVSYETLMTNKIYRLSERMSYIHQKLTTAKQKRTKFSKISVMSVVATTIIALLGSLLTSLGFSSASILALVLSVCSSIMAGACILKKEQYNKEVTSLNKEVNALQVEKFNLLNSYSNEKQHAESCDVFYFGDEDYVNGIDKNNKDL